MPDRKILIASTPKTGNTWAKRLLAAVYGLPVVELPAEFGAAALQAVGRQWVAHQHYAPQAELLSWASETGADIVTTVRHPGDVLVSLLHYVRYAIAARRVSGFGFSPALAATAEDGDTPGPRTLAYVEREFFALLYTSLAWAAGGRASVVRYEDLWHDPVGTLDSVCRAIAPPGRTRLETAVESADIGLLREVTPADRGFFRQGGVGAWRDALPGACVDVLRRQAPYPAILEALGYDFEAVPLRTSPARPARSAPFGTPRRFSDGTPVPAVAVQAFLSEAAAGRTWADPASVGAPGSFHAWLCAPADRDPTPAAEPLVTNLAAFVYRGRGDIHLALPEPFGTDRERFALWFTHFAAPEYQLPAALVAPMSRGVAAWAARHVDDPGPDLPPLPRVVQWLHEQRPDLELSPSPLLRRLELLLWFFAAGVAELDLASEYVAPLRDEFERWATAPAGAGAPLVTRLMACLHAGRDDVRAGLPDLLGADRVGVAAWFLRHAPREYALGDALVAGVRDSFAAWAAEVDPTDPLAAGGEGAAVLPRLVTHFYGQRADVRADWPDPFGRHRLECLGWGLVHVPAEYGLDAAVVGGAVDRLRAWGNAPCDDDPRAGDPGVPALTNFGLLLHRNSAPLQAQFPDPFGADREAYITCLLLEPTLFGQPAGPLVAPLVEAVARASCARRAITSP
jgi:hypothetical protein